MAVICTDVSKIKDELAMEKLEDKFEFDWPKEVKTFFKENNGGIPKRAVFAVEGEEYEIRCFLSFNNDEYNSIKLPLESFQEETQGKIVPIAKDSGDNYYCLHLLNNKIYYWNCDDGLYYCVAEDFQSFISLLD